jgi:glutamate-1-semialdehyde aminotransferase
MLPTEDAGWVGAELARRFGLRNRGVLITPFHNMALMSRDTTETEVHRHTAAFAEAVAALAG